MVIAKASVAWIGYWSFQGNNVEQVVTAELSLISPKVSVWTTLVKFSQLFECSDLQQAGRCWTDAYWVKLKESLHVNTWKINTKWSIEENRNTQRCSLSKKRYYSVKNTHREISNLRKVMSIWQVQAYLCFCFVNENNKVIIKLYLIILQFSK